MIATPIRVALAVSLLLGAASACNAICCLCDPVVTHTNGMRLASSTPERSHMVYWTCNPLHLGYCGGRMQGPCRSDLRSLGTRSHGCFPLPPGPSPGPVSPRSAHAADGMELGDGERVGAIPLGPFPFGAATPALVNN